MGDGTTLLDQVGLSAGSAFREGPSLTQLTASVNQSYERRAGGAAGSSVDTNDNAGDFQLISPSDPQNLTSALTPALFSVTPTPQDFGPVALGSARSATLTITNNSTALVALTTPFTIAGADAAQFSVGAPGATSLSGGSATTVAVAFTPATLGPKSARLAIASSNGGERSVDLAGTAVCPAIDVSGPLAAGTFGLPYSGMLTASGGALPYEFTATGGLPGGLTLTGGGAIGGTPTLAGLYSFTIHVTDANGCSGAAGFSIAIERAAVAVTWAAPAPIVYGTALGGSQPDGR